MKYTYKKLNTLVEIATAMEAGDCFIVAVDQNVDYAIKSAGERINLDVFDHYTREEAWEPEVGQTVRATRYGESEIEVDMVFVAMDGDRYICKRSAGVYIAYTEVKPIEPEKEDLREGWVFVHDINRTDEKSDLVASHGLMEKVYIREVPKEQEDE